MLVSAVQAAWVSHVDTYIPSLLIHTSSQPLWVITEPRAELRLTAAPALCLFHTWPCRDVTATLSAQPTVRLPSCVHFLGLLLYSCPTSSFIGSVFLRLHTVLKNVGERWRLPAVYPASTVLIDFLLRCLPLSWWISLVCSKGVEPISHF